MKKISKTALRTGQKSFLAGKKQSFCSKMAKNKLDEPDFVQIEDMLLKKDAECNKEASASFFPALESDSSD